MPVDLGQSIDSLTDQLRCLVCVVPILVYSKVAEPKVSARVDHGQIGLAKFSYKLRRRSGRIGDNGGIEVIEVELIDGLENFLNAMLRVNLAEWLSHHGLLASVHAYSSVSACGDRSQFEVRMKFNQLGNH